MDFSYDERVDWDFLWSICFINVAVADNPCGVVCTKAIAKSEASKVSTGRTGGVTTAGDNINITGSGTLLDPYVVTNSAVRIGQALNGGTVFYVDGSGQSGLIMANDDEPGGAIYEYTTAAVLNGTGDLYDGAANSAILLALGAGQAPAAEACAARGAGWFLPSFLQLRRMFKSTAILQNLTNAALTAYYWASTENGAGFGYTTRSDFAVNSQAKNNTLRVRCIRAF